MALIGNKKERKSSAEMFKNAQAEVEGMVSPGMSKMDVQKVYMAGSGMIDVQSKANEAHDSIMQLSYLPVGAEGYVIFRRFTEGNLWTWETGLLVLVMVATLVGGNYIGNKRRDRVLDKGTSKAIEFLNQNGTPNQTDSKGAI